MIGTQDEIAQRGEKAQEEMQNIVNNMKPVAEDMKGVMVDKVYKGEYIGYGEH